MNEHLNKLRAKIESRTAYIGVVGLGYVGLPLACEIARLGYAVTGVDIDEARIAKIRSGHNPIEGIEPGLDELLAKVVLADGNLSVTTEYSALSEADIVTLNVDTPVDAEHVPRYTALRSACQSIAKVIKRGALVIIESTVAPGTALNLVVPILEAAQKIRLNEDFFVGVCPERVMPGRLLRNLRELARVCGGSDHDVAVTMSTFYSVITRGDVDPTDLTTAEIVKTAENAYRDVQIAFANELAMICEAAGGDFLKVRELVNKSPGRNVLFAGSGVGGHCIPKDSWLLLNGSSKSLPLTVIPGARKTNDYMPTHVKVRLEQNLQRLGVNTLVGSRIAILGFAYLEDSDDARNSPSAALDILLKAAGCQTYIHDPFVIGYRHPIAEVIRDCDAAIFMVAHSTYRRIDSELFMNLMRHRLIIDTRRVLERSTMEKAGFTYVALGAG